MKDNTEIQPLKLIVFGEGGVGKSALTIRYACQKYSDEYLPTIEDTYPTSVEVSGVAVKVEVIDTAGHQIFCRMREEYIKSGDGFVIVYSVTDKWSFHAVSGIWQQVIELKGEKDKIIPSTPLVIVGNKCDLDEERQVTFQEGERLSKKLHCQFYETSAKNDIGVGELFEGLVKTVQEVQKERPRNTFVRDRTRFSLRNLSVGERKCKEKLQAFKEAERKSFRRRRAFSVKGLMCGSGKSTAV